MPQPSVFEWPVPVAESRPWTRWWWLGSAVDEDGLTRQLDELRRAGFGGVEICPIYGAKGWEDRYVPFLSPRFVALLGHTSREAKRLGMRFDLTTGTGWPFGGPNVSGTDASSGLVLERHELNGGERLSRALPEGRVECVLASSTAGERVPLTDHVSAQRTLDWTAPAGRWRVYVAVARGSVQQVKRAAPGGEGNVLDPFSPPALQRYLQRFDAALAGWRDDPPRAHFHDSFEYYGASWTPAFFDEFAARRGYDLRGELPALAGDGPAPLVSRVRADYRETLSDLHLEYVRLWTAWAHARSSLTRNQAHGAPGNLVDLYAAADIPETEVFGASDESLLPRLKLASSAAHVTGRTLASAEAFTWLGEHFQVTLAQSREAADRLFLSGVNQLVFHGIPYSPSQAPWPGWQFYAAVNFGPGGGLWRDLPELTAYLTRCQSILQSGEPDEDVLLYYPVHDAWHEAGELVMPNPLPAGFQATALALSQHGYAWDAVSDRLLANASVEEGRVRLGAGRYRAIVLPRVERMPVETARRLLDLARMGAAVAVVGEPPADVPGLADLDARRARLREALRPLEADRDERGAVRQHAVGRGRVLVGDDVVDLLARLPVAREPMVEAGVQFVRRRQDRGRHYFVVNRSATAIDGWVTLGTPALSVVRLDPRWGAPGGLVALRPRADGASEIQLQLLPGESAVLRTFTTEANAGPPWPSYEPVGVPVPLDASWRVSFVEGGPVLPAGFDTRALASWTERSDEDARRFAGTARYTTTFELPGTADDWQLDLGGVAETARVRVNGRLLGVVWCPPFRLRVGAALRPGTNVLDLEVTNLAANRVRDLDRRGESWKYFHDANVVGKDYKPLDASTWPHRPSGLLGPVALQALRVRAGERATPRP